MKIQKTSFFLGLVVLIILASSQSIRAQDNIIRAEVSVLEFKENSKNAHEMIQKAIDYAFNNNIPMVTVPDGDYEIDATVEKGILLRSNIHLKLNENAILKALPSNSGNYSIVRIHNARDTELSGGKIVGERYEHTGTGGEWGMGIDIRNSSNIKITDIHVSNCWGDGIYITRNSTGIVISDVICDNNRRQGMSVIDVDGLFVKNSLFTNTNGTGPASGIDLEPNEGDFVTNVFIDSCTFTNNAGLGLHMYGKYGDVTHVKATNCIVDNNPIGVSLRYKGVNQVNLSNINISNSRTQGLRVFQGSKDVKISNVTITESKKNGITISEAISVILSNFIISNYDQGILIEKSKDIKLNSMNFSSDSAGMSSMKILDSKLISMDKFIVNGKNIKMDAECISSFKITKE